MKKKQGKNHRVFKTRKKGRSVMDACQYGEAGKK